MVNTLKHINEGRAIIFLSSLGNDYWTPLLQSFVGGRSAFFVLQKFSFWAAVKKLSWRMGWRKATHSWTLRPIKPCPFRNKSCKLCIILNPFVILFVCQDTASVSSNFSFISFSKVAYCTLFPVTRVEEGWILDMAVNRPWRYWIATSKETFLMVLIDFS